MFKEFNNLNDFEAAFPDEKSCIEHFHAVRWPKGAACPHCGSMSRIYKLAPVGTYKCGDCRKKFTVRHGTIFGDSKLPLRTWFKAIFLMTSHKKGISSCQLARDLGLGQKAAWFVLQRIREATMTKEFRRPPLSGPVEMDETLLGGKEHWKHANKRAKFAQGRGSMYSKTIVFGMIQRGGELRLQRIRRFTREEIQNIVTKNVRMNATVHTDEATHYHWMRKNYAHSLVKHRFGEYVRGDVTTNRIEGAFSHFKRSVVGVYHKVSDEHIDRYLGMFGWRWTRRGMGEGERVNALLKSTPGHRITYKELTRKEAVE